MTCHNPKKNIPKVTQETEGAIVFKKTGQTLTYKYTRAVPLRG